MKKKSIFVFGLAVVVLFGIVFANSLNLFKQDTSNVVAAIVAVDINPSFELSTNSEGVVLKVEAMNDDAKTLATADLVGKPVAEAIDLIVQRANQAGFVDIEDLEDDYVVVSTVLMEKTAEAVRDRLHTQLQDRIRLSDTLQCMNVVELKAERIAQFEANEKEIPLGLYVLKGMVNLPDGTSVTVKEFFANEQNKEKVKNKIHLTEATQEKVRERIELALNKLENAGVDTTELRTRLENASAEQMMQIQNEVRNKQEDPGQGGNGNGNGSTEDGGNGDGNTGDDSGTQQGSGSDSGGSTGGEIGRASCRERVF